MRNPDPPFTTTPTSLASGSTRRVLPEALVIKPLGSLITILRPYVKFSFILVVSNTLGRVSVNEEYVDAVMVTEYLLYLLFIFMICSTIQEQVILRIHIIGLVLILLLAVN